MTKKAIVIGASSGIGRALVVELAKNGYTVGLMSRRINLLEDLQKEIPTETHASHLDMTHPEEARQKVKDMIEKLGGLDLLIINAGTGHINPKLEWNKEKDTIDTNVSGFCALATLGYNYFSSKNDGILVGISSIGALMANNHAPAYNASKAFVSNYLEGLQKKAYLEKKEITIIDIKPGYVDTPMAQGDGKFWVATPEKAAEQIYSAIKNKKKHAYITKRWRLIGWCLKLLPKWVLQRV